MILLSIILTFIGKHELEARFYRNCLFFSERFQTIYKQKAICGVNKVITMNVGAKQFITILIVVSTIVVVAKALAEGVVF